MGGAVTKTVSNHQGLPRSESHRREPKLGAIDLKRSSLVGDAVPEENTELANSQAKGKGTSPSIPDLGLTSLQVPINSTRSISNKSLNDSFESVASSSSIFSPRKESGQSGPRTNRSTCSSPRGQSWYEEEEVDKEAKFNRKRKDSLTHLGFAIAGNCSGMQMDALKQHLSQWESTAGSVPFTGNGPMKGIAKAQQSLTPRRRSVNERNQCHSSQTSDRDTSESPTLTSVVVECESNSERAVIVLERHEYDTSSKTQGKRCNLPRHSPESSADGTNSAAASIMGREARTDCHDDGSSHSSNEINGFVQRRLDIIDQDYCNAANELVQLTNSFLQTRLFAEAAAGASGTNGKGAEKAAALRRDLGVTKQCMTQVCSTMNALIERRREMETFLARPNHKEKLVFERGSTSRSPPKLPGARLAHSPLQEVASPKERTSPNLEETIHHSFRDESSNPCQ